MPNMAVTLFWCPLLILVLTLNLKQKRLNTTVLLKFEHHGEKELRFSSCLVSKDVLQRFYDLHLLHAKPSLDSNGKRKLIKHRRSWSHKRISYYNNATSTFNLILCSADVETRWVGDDREVDYLQEFAGSLNKGSNSINIAHINIRSLRNKVEEIKLLLNVCRLDILAITETYLDKKIDNKQLEIENNWK